MSYLADDDPAILKLALDVTRPDSVEAAFKAAAFHYEDKFYIDVLVNSAGYSLSGDTEAATEEEMHDEFETNFFGTVRVTMKAVQVMRQADNHRGGLVFNISSLAGVAAFPGHAFYHASKFAVEGWTESVAREMHPDWNSQSNLLLNSDFFSRFFVGIVPSSADLALRPLVNFCIVEPAAVKTNFEGHSKKKTKPHEAYAGADMPARKLEVMVEHGLKAGVGILQPTDVAKALYQVASRNEKVPLHLPLSTTAVKLITLKLQGRLQALETVKELSAIDQGQT